VIHRRTRQLSAVLAAVQAERDHPTAQAIYERVRQRMPTISRGTVYRNLNKLEQEKRVRSFRLAGGPVLYDGMATDHDHFVCQLCGSIRDLEGSRVHGERHRQLRRAGYVVERQSMTYYGLCPNCRTTN
jgi:Fe2+ or Zn2+ uptake regulation protein